MQVDYYVSDQFGSAFFNSCKVTLCASCSLTRHLHPVMGLAAPSCASLLFHQLPCVCRKVAWVASCNWVIVRCSIHSQIGKYAVWI